MTTTKGISAATHKCCRGNDGCLYTSFRTMSSTLKSKTNEFVQRQVADRIFIREINKSQSLKTKAKYKTIEDCFHEIKNGNLCGGENELQVLAMISRLMIRLLSMKSTTDNDNHIEIVEYGPPIVPFEECVYLFYDDEKKQYAPLWIVNKEEPDEIITIFQCNDQAVRELFVGFIRAQIHEDALTDIDRENTFNKFQHSAKDIREIEDIEGMLFSTLSINLSNKRKLPNHASLSLGETAIQELSSVSTNNTNGESKKRAKVRNDQTCTRKTRNSESTATGRISTVNLVTSPPVNQELTTAFPLIDSVRQQKMKFEVEPALKFRGRTPGDFKPKKKQNRKGKPSAPRPPRYFADRNNKRVLNLLIRASCLSPYAQYRLEIYLITREISGCSYKHPYFKFLILPLGTERFDENPKYVRFTLADLKEYSKEMKQLPLQLVVVQQKKSQLMRIAQPLEIFSSLNSASAITTKYKNKDAFKKAYHLNDFRFAVTLCKRESGETDFRRCEDMQFISQISTTVKKHKISKK